uniref:Uncharacterized protein n=1 Tax=Manihot esculenta TaxID=3983 RepID=A0A2C9WHD2_MANES
MSGVANIVLADLYLCNVLVPLGNKSTAAQRQEFEENKLKKLKALASLHSTLSDVIFIKIMACKSQKQIWYKLKEEFKGNARMKSTNVLNLKRQFKASKINEGESVKNFSSKFLDVVRKMRLLGEEFLDEKVTQKISISLPMSFEPKISAIEKSCDIKTMSVF